MELYDTMLKRRSVRKYSDGKIPEEKLKKIIEAGLLAPSSRNIKPCGFYVIEDGEILRKLSEAKASGAGMLAECAAAIAVFADGEKADTWIEDSSTALSYMNLMAVDQGIGSCWCQIHLRSSKQGEDAESLVRKILSVPENFRIVGILALGIPNEEPSPHSEKDIDWSRVVFQPRI